MTTGSWIAICGFKPRFSSFPKFGLKMKMGYVGLAERYIGAGTGRKPLIFNYLLAEVLPFIPTTATDMDGDGDTDILVIANHGVSWFENINGSGIFWAEHLVINQIEQFSTLSYADVDKDGDIDILIVCGEIDDITHQYISHISWLENSDGSGNSWSEHLLDDSLGFYYAKTADMDGDGDLDIVGSGHFITAWWQNTDGSGNSWTKHTVNGSFDGPCFQDAADMDGDGDMDLLGPAYVSDYGPVDLVWWENTNGVGTSWTEHLVSAGFSGLLYYSYSLRAVDIDLDGDMDVLNSDNYSDIGWWENTDGSGTIWAERPRMDTEFYLSGNYLAADIDNDGDLDYLGTARVDSEDSNTSIIFWKNIDGAGTVWSEYLVNPPSRSIFSVYAADIDNDGDMDAIGASYQYNGISWWENTDSLGTIWAGHMVEGFSEGTISVQAADIDGDGDADIVGAARDADDITWWQNTDGSGSSWTKHVVDNSFDGAYSVHIADMDNDGDADIMGAARDADDIAWWKNTDGSGTSWTKYIVDGSFEGANSVNAADIDNDGDMDLIGTANGSARDADDIAWWQNTDGSGNSWTKHVVDNSFDSAYSIRAVDMDNDGDMDLLIQVSAEDDKGELVFGSAIGKGLELYFDFFNLFT
jgi:hypothetical protein